MRPFVSVIIPIYNQEKYLKQTVRSVLNQTYPHFELILVDDGSKDRSQEIIRSLQKLDQRIKSIHIENSGKPKAVEKGVAISQGDLLAFLDHDDLMLPERLEKQVNYLSYHKEVSGVSCHSFYIDESNTVLGFQKYGNLNTIEDAKARMAGDKAVMCSFTGLTVRKDAFLETGGLRSAFWPCDDLDFINRFFEHGFLAVILQEVLVKYRIHKNSMTSRSQWFLFKMSDYTYYCRDLRNQNLPEISFEAFKALKAKESKWKKGRKTMHNYSILYLQKANFDLNSKRILKFFYNISAAALLDPVYVWANVRKRIAKSRARDPSGNY